MALDIPRENAVLIPYLRVSTDRQADEGFGLSAQLHSITIWADRHGFTLASPAVERGVSGSVPAQHREAFRLVLTALDRQRLVGVIVARLDRLARDLMVQEAALAALWQRGARLYSADQGLIPEDSEGDYLRKAIRQVVGALAEMDKAAINARLLAGRREKARRGLYAHGAPPYGWRAEHKALVPEPQEQQVVRLMQALRAQGSTLEGIAAHLNAHNVRSKYGGRWYGSSVRSALTVAARLAAQGLDAGE